MIIEDKFQYIIAATKNELLELLHSGKKVHFHCTPKPEHRAACNFYVREFLTKNMDFVTCEDCNKIILRKFGMK